VKKFIGRKDRDYFMPRPKTYRVENITIRCDKSCPLFYCNEPCRIREHIKKYAEVMDEEGSFTIL